MSIDATSIKKRKSIAIVSGKGGSGKTMVAATLAQVLSEQARVLLIDADFGTAGLSYYLGLNTVANISTGLTNLIDMPNGAQLVDEFSQPMIGFDRSRFLPLGDHKRHIDKPAPSDLTAQFFSDLVDWRRLTEDIVIVDCRGGIDADSLAVCQSVDSIIVVAETDTTSFQATQHLVEVLARKNLSRKLAGFLINKVFDDPSTIARAGTASFKCQYLGSIPFDLEATKRFLLGQLPQRGGMFTSQVWHAVFRLFPEVVRHPSVPPLSFEDFRNLSIRDNNSALGGMLLSLLSLGSGTVLLMQNLGLTELSHIEGAIFLQSLVVLAVFSGIEPIRRIFGRVFSAYAAALARLFGSNR